MQTRAEVRYCKYNKFLKHHEVRDRLSQGNFAKTREWKFIWEMYNFPFQTHKSYTWESCTNHINGILPLIINGI